jgi:hypothetical protein
MYSHWLRRATDPVALCGRAMAPRRAASPPDMTPRCPDCWREVGERGLYVDEHWWTERG